MVVMVKKRTKQAGRHAALPTYHTSVFLIPCHAAGNRRRGQMHARCPQTSVKRGFFMSEKVYRAAIYARLLKAANEMK